RVLHRVHCERENIECAGWNWKFHLAMLSIGSGSCFRLAVDIVGGTLGTGRANANFRDEATPVPQPRAYPRGTGTACRRAPSGRTTAPLRSRDSPVRSWSAYPVPPQNACART